jgi:hypothetical protein
MEVDMYKNLKNRRSIPLLDPKDIKNLQKPLGKAIYKNSQKFGRPRKNEEDKARPNDRIICNICGEIFTRNNRNRHKDTKIHKAYENMNNKLYKLLLDDKNE